MGFTPGLLGALSGGFWKQALQALQAPCASARESPCRNPVSNGAGLGDERVSKLLVFGFLQNCSNSGFHSELLTLGFELPMRLQGPIFSCGLKPQDDELQTDGNRSSHLFFEGEEPPDSERQEEIIQDIARNLAQIGDSLDGRIQPELVNNLAARFQDPSLSEDERRKCLASALDQLTQTFPKDMEKEKMMLVLTMLLAKKVADHTPSLLGGIFRTAVNLIINRNLLTYVRNLIRNEMD
ncbi:PREDICTED: BH3-interacting domain death agonist [Condylura cristata]|uniref:BH3-interacting domain death agonist n=1 Tax=Condylura cristata TaxID=143302 RepID=UPI0003345903|nr:PREDICTED: BH3-interacting domain death agonist [Condylura cristata]